MFVQTIQGERFEHFFEEQIYFDMSDCDLDTSDRYVPFDICFLYKSCISICWIICLIDKVFMFEDDDVERQTKLYYMDI